MKTNDDTKAQFYPTPEQMAIRINSRAEYARQHNGESAIYGGGYDIVTNLYVDWLESEVHKLRLLLAETMARRLRDHESGESFCQPPNT